MNFNRSSAFNSIYIIESLPEGDLKTGRDLYENCVYPLGDLKEGLYTSLSQPISKNEFIQTLAWIIDGCKVNNRGPILHIESHGCSEGIATASGELIYWRELKPYLCALNEISRLNLLVVMAACNGMDLAKVILPTDRAPVWAIIGPPNPVKAGCVIDGFKAFYNKFFKTYDGREALNELNNSPDVKDWDFAFINAEFFFMYVYKNYVESLCTETAFIDRSKKIIKDLIAGRPINPDDEKRMVNEFCLLLKSTQQLFFEKHKVHYFMIDLVNENETRFQVTFEQCMRFLVDQSS